MDRRTFFRRCLGGAVAFVAAAVGARAVARPELPPGPHARNIVGNLWRERFGDVIRYKGVDMIPDPPAWVRRRMGVYIDRHGNPILPQATGAWSGRGKLHTEAPSGT